MYHRIGVRSHSFSFFGDFVDGILKIFDGCFGLSLGKHFLEGLHSISLRVLLEHDSQGLMSRGGGSE